MEYLLGPVPLLHARILMNLLTFRLPFYKLCYLFMHVVLFCILVAEILFSSSSDSMYCNILTFLLYG